MTKQGIEYLPPDALRPWARNARIHSKKQLHQIGASIETFGFTNPVLIDQANTILAGHGRVEAAKQLGLAKVPCIRIEHMTEAEKRAYVIADNKLGLVTYLCRSKCSFRPLGVRRPRGFFLPMLNVDGAGYRSR